MWCRQSGVIKRSLLRVLDREVGVSSLVGRVKIWNRVSVRIKMAAAWRSNLGKHVREIRIHLCQKSQSSQGVRDFLEKYYIGIKKENPKVPILVRECSGIQPKMYLRYDHGKENSVQLNNMSGDSVLQAMEKLVTSGSL